MFDQANQGSGVRNTLTIKKKISGRESVRVIDFHHDSKVSEPIVLDGYVLSVFFDAMSSGSKIDVKGKLSDQAIRNFSALGEAWKNMNPNLYKPVEISADHVIHFDPKTSSPWEQTTGKDGAILTFSGGLDSHFTAARHSGAHHITDRPTGIGFLSTVQSYNIAQAVMVHGFDVRYENSKDFTDLRKNSETNLNRMNLPLVTVRTNIRVNETDDWEHSFGAKVSSVLHQFSNRFKYGLIASGSPYSRPLVSWGSQPSIDHLYSGSFMHIVHDGAGFSRSEKALLISKIPELLPGIKVCWEGEEQGKNCGMCEKCIRTRLNFLSVGLPNPPCFDSEFNLSMIETISVSNQTQLLGFQNVLDFSKKNKTDNSEWFNRLQERVALLRNQLDQNTSEHEGKKILPRGVQSTQHQFRARDNALVVNLVSEKISKQSDDIESMNKRLSAYGSSLAEFLRTKGPLSLLSEMPGNIGDHLIWSGTQRFLEKERIDFTNIPVNQVLDKRNFLSNQTLVVPGSGAMTSLFNEWLPQTITDASNVYGEVVILPSEFETEVTTVQNCLLLANVYPFARDADSYGKIKQLGKAGLGLDLALWAFDFRTPIPQNFSDTNPGNVLLALRTDSASKIDKEKISISGTNNDISLTTSNLNEFLETILAADTVVTDRLHVAVSGVMMGKNVRFVDPFNHKISRYLRYNFGNRFTERTQQRDENWLLSQGYVTRLGR
jgi:exopolysaccharide biosynthesis predicted pyruvyltransferase EpsI